MTFINYELFVKTKRETRLGKREGYNHTRLEGSCENSIAYRQAKVKNQIVKTRRHSQTKIQEALRRQTKSPEPLDRLRKGTRPTREAELELVMPSAEKEYK